MSVPAVKGLIPRNITDCRQTHESFQRNTFFYKYFYLQTTYQNIHICIQIILMLISAGASFLIRGQH